MQKIDLKICSPVFFFFFSLSLHTHFKLWGADSSFYEVFNWLMLYQSYGISYSYTNCMLSASHRLFAGAQVGTVTMATKTTSHATCKCGSLVFLICFEEGSDMCFNLLVKCGIVIVISCLLFKGCIKTIGEI